MTIDQLINFDGKVPEEVTVEDKSLMEQGKLIQQLEPEEKNIVFKMVDTFLTKEKFKDFLKKRILKHYNLSNSHKHLSPA